MCGNTAMSLFFHKKFYFTAILTFTTHVKNLFKLKLLSVHILKKCIKFKILPKVM